MADQDPARAVFDWGWVGFLAYFVALEAFALWRSYRAGYRGGTLSEHVWLWFGVDRGVKPNWWAYLRRFVLVAGMAWLTVHFVGGGRLV